MSANNDAWLYHSHDAQEEERLARQGLDRAEIARQDQDAELDRRDRHAREAVKDLQIRMEVTS